MVGQVLQDSTNLTRPREGAQKDVPVGSAASLTKEEVLDIYQNCIKLAAESKINAKNSFNLRLIEHMEDLVREDDENETNFQKASCTLDAGVQIYSYRVDAVHTDAFKTLQGLNRTAVQTAEDAEEDCDGDESSGANGDKRRKKRNIDPTATLEEYSALDVKKLDLGFAVDPLFHRTSAQFDAGGAHGLLLHNLNVLHGCEIVFDSNDVPEQLMARESLDRDVKLEMQGLPEVLSRQPQSIAISPAVEELRRRLRGTGAVAMAIPETGASFASIMEVHGLFGKSNRTDLLPTCKELELVNDDHEGWGDESAFYSAEEHVSPGGNSSVYYGMSEEVGQSEEVSHMPDMDFGPIDTSLTSAQGGEKNMDVSDDANSFEHLITNYLGPELLSGVNWAGASHWRFRSATAASEKPRKGGQVEDESDDTSSVQTGRKSNKKKKIELDFLNLPPLPSHAFQLASKPASLCLASSTLEAQASTLLPEDHKYQVCDLMKPFLRPRSLWGRRRAPSQGLDADPGPEGFAVWEEGHDGDQGGEDDIGFGEDGDYDEGNWSTVDNISLAEAPRKVDKVAINYSRVAKQVDVRALKELLWDRLGKTFTADQLSGDEHSPKEVSSEAVSFENVLTTLPEFSAAGAIEDLSVHLCFICALHLANEHGLHITSGENLDSLSIRQS